MTKEKPAYVPARQLQVVGATLEALKGKLLENETGWSKEDKALFYKWGKGHNDVLPIGVTPIVEMTPDEVTEMINDFN